jgi:hypothetical protein
MREPRVAATAGRKALRVREVRVFTTLSFTARAAQSDSAAGTD